MYRDPTIDIFRGLDILEMEITESCDNSFFDHATYDEMEMKYADTIFPCFSFISGMTMKKMGVVPLKRSMQLIGLGVIFNSIPSFLEDEKLRYLGVLQRHGLSTIILNNLVSKKLKQSNIFPLTMTGIWLLVSVLYSNNKKKPFSSQKDTAQQKIDSPIFGDRTYHENFDPEGLLGALMTAVTIWSGMWFAEQNLTDMKTLLLGTGLLVGGKLASTLVPQFLPISKPLWTPTFVMMSNGWSILKYFVLKKSLKYLPHFFSRSLQLVGRQSMEVYFIGEILLLFLKYTNKGKKSSVWSLISTKLNYVFSNAATQTILVASFNAILIGSAYLCSNFNLKIRFL